MSSSVGRSHECTSMSAWLIHAYDLLPAFNFNVCAAAHASFVNSMCTQLCGPCELQALVETGYLNMESYILTQVSDPWSILLKWCWVYLCKTVSFLNFFFLLNLVECLGK